MGRVITCKDGVNLSIGFDSKSLNVSTPEAELPLSVVEQVRGITMLNIGMTIHRRIKQDIAENNTPEFYEKFHARCREMGNVLREIFPDYDEI